MIFVEIFFCCDFNGNKKEKDENLIAKNVKGKNLLWSKWPAEKAQLIYCFNHKKIYDQTGRCDSVQR